MSAPPGTIALMAQSHAAACAAAAYAAGSAEGSAAAGGVGDLQNLKLQNL
jgi:hypothetical protein